MSVMEKYTRANIDALYRNICRLGEFMTTVIVIGGGAGGCGTADALASSGFKVKLIEEKSELLSGTSNATPGRMGLGFHYIDFKTGAMYMKQTIEVIKKYPDFLLAGQKDEKDPLRRGRYFIVKNSLFPKEEILAVYKQYQQEYERLIAEDPSNEVFGPADEFFRILDPAEYQDDVNMDLVDVGIETKEHLLDWPRFRKFYIGQLEKNSNIEILTDHKVEKVTKGKNKRFEVSVRSKNGNERVFEANYAVNATWDKMEEVREGLDIPPAQMKMSNRLKVLLEVELPPQLVKKNSMFFCMGPHGMFSNLGGGRGLMTYAPKSNVSDWKTGHVQSEGTSQMTALLKRPPTEREINEYGGPIREGVSQFIPQMKNAKILNVRFGVVRVAGKNVDIFDHNSDIHKREGYGVEELIPGWFENNCMKLLYFSVNGEIVLKKLRNRVGEDAKKAKKEGSTTSHILVKLECLPSNASVSELSFTNTGGDSSSNESFHKLFHQPPADKASINNLGPLPSYCENTLHQSGN